MLNVITEGLVLRTILPPEAGGLLASVMSLIPPQLPARLVVGTGLINVCGTELSHTNLSSRPLLKCPESSHFQILWGEVRGVRPFHAFLASSLIKA